MSQALALCRGLRDLDVVSRFVERSSASGSVILASDDSAIQDQARGLPWVKDVVFIETMDSVFVAAGETLRLREQVNRSFRALAPELPAHCTDWIRWAEGGETTQRLQDLVLLRGAYQKLLAKKPERVLFVGSVQTRFEDLVLREEAERLGIRAFDLSAIQARWLSRLEPRAVRKNWLGRERSLWVPEAWLSALKALRLVADVLVFGHRSGTRRPFIFLLGDPAPRHLLNVTRVMKECEKLHSGMSQLLAWRALGSSAQARSQGLMAEDLESYCSARSLVASGWRARAVRASLRANRTELVREHGQAIYWLMLRFTRNELFARIALSEACRSYLRGHMPVAIKTWGESILETGFVFASRLREAVNDQKAPKPLEVHYAIGLMGEMPYFGAEYCPDLHFVSGEIDRELTQRYVPSQTQIVVNGFAGSSAVQEFGQRFSPAESRQELGLPPASQSGLTVFYASNTVVRGYLSSAEHSFVARQLFELVARTPGLTLVVKPHPAEPNAFWQNLYSKADCPERIRIVLRDQSPYHCIQAVDLVLTKFSTLALEAMLLERPVICFGMDQEPRFLSLFGSGAETFSRWEDLSAHLGRFAGDRGAFEQWRQKRIQAQRDFLPRKLTRLPISPEGVIAAEVWQRIQDMELFK